jgi:ATP-dependent exoDNAse (exonuclease V) alpha subunit
MDESISRDKDFQKKLEYTAITRAREQIIIVK